MNWCQVAGFVYMILSEIFYHILYMPVHVSEWKHYKNWSLVSFLTFEIITWYFVESFSIYTLG